MRVKQRFGRIDIGTEAVVVTAITPSQGRRYETIGDQPRNDRLRRCGRVDARHRKRP
jgi:hypothetical protein